MPFARATGIGSTFDCADHSYNVCFLVRSTISFPVIVGVAVAVVIQSSLSFPSKYLFMNFHLYTIFHSDRNERFASRSTTATFKPAVRSTPASTRQHAPALLPAGPALHPSARRSPPAASAA